MCTFLLQNVTLWDMELVCYGICATVQLTSRSHADYNHNCVTNHLRPYDTDSLSNPYHFHQLRCFVTVRISISNISFCHLEKMFTCKPPLKLPLPYTPKVLHWRHKGLSNNLQLCCFCCCCCCCCLLLWLSSHKTSKSHITGALLREVPLTKHQ